MLVGEVQVACGLNRVSEATRPLDGDASRDAYGRCQHGAGQETRHGTGSAVAEELTVLIFVRADGSFAVLETAAYISQRTAKK